MNQNIVIGKATLCWGYGSVKYMEGWVLPGGKRTINRDQAESVCQKMNKMMGPSPNKSSSKSKGD